MVFPMGVAIHMLEKFTECPAGRIVKYKLNNKKEITEMTSYKLSFLLNSTARSYIHVWKFLWWG